MYYDVLGDEAFTELERRVGQETLDEPASDLVLYGTRPGYNLRRSSAPGLGENGGLPRKA